MPVELFESTLRSMQSEGYIIKEIEYCGQGEAMTHPQFNEFVELARTFYPNTIQRLITNGNFDYARAKMTSAVDEIMVSCDGARQASYERYRVGGNLPKVLKFMRDVPKSIGDKRQRVVWKYILFEFNDSDDEIMEAQRLAEENGADTLLFVFTHTRYKAERYNNANSHLLPIVWHGARANATPIHYQSVHSFQQTTLAGWPARSSDNLSSMMLDDIVMDGGGGLHVRGWVVSIHEVSRVRLTHNGVFIGETALLDPRPDVEDAHPSYTGGNPGFALGWKTAAPAEENANHEIGIEIISTNDKVVGTFSREFFTA